jgi:type IV pilus assembly protein PilM
MSKTSIGLDIGTRAVRAVELKGGPGHQSVVRFGRVLMPAGAMDHGEVQNPTAVAEAIQTLWKRLRMSGKSVHIGIANRRVVVRVIELPAMADEDLKSAIKLQAQDHIPIPLSEAVMDYEILERVDSPDGQPVVRVLVVAAERASVMPLLEAVKMAKLDAKSLELNAYPLVRALGNGSDEAEAIVDIGAGVTTVVIHLGGRIRFTRILPTFGGDDFTAAVADGMGVETEQAETLKRQASLDLAALVRGENSDQSVVVTPSFSDSSLEEEHSTVAVESSQRGVAQMMEPVLQRFVSEVRGSVDFYTSQPGAANVGRVVLTGGGSMLGGLSDAITNALGITADVGHPFARVPMGSMNVSADQTNVAERYMSVALGLALVKP